MKMTTPGLKMSFLKIVLSSMSVRSCKLYHTSSKQGLDLHSVGWGVGDEICGRISG